MPAGILGCTVMKNGEWGVKTICDKEKIQNLKKKVSRQGRDASLYLKLLPFPYYQFRKV